MISMMQSMMGSVNIGGMSIDSSMMASFEKYYNSWQELINNQQMLEEQYEIVKGNWPQAYNEVVLIVDKNNEISDLAIQGLGITTAADMMKAFMAIQSGEEYKADSYELEYDDILGMTFKIVLEPDYFRYNEETKTWDDMHGDDEYVGKLIENGQVATQYVDLNGNPSMDTAFNPNSSMYASKSLSERCPILRLFSTKTYTPS